MRQHRQATTERPALELAETALWLVRNAPRSAPAVYYLGSLPFIAGMVAFWAHMAGNPAAHRLLAPGAFALAVLFVWMKVFQARYCRELLAILEARAPEPWGWRAFWRSATVQAPLQAIGVVALPLALAAALPFGWAYAVCQHATVLDGGDYPSVRALYRDALREAKLWPKQNHLLIWLLSPYLPACTVVLLLALMPFFQALLPGMLGVPLTLYAGLLALLSLVASPFCAVVALNLFAAILFGASMLRTFLDVHTVFTVAPGAAVNTTFFALIIGLTYLAVDPVLKAAYVLRCFHGRSLQNGADLRVRLRRVARALAPLLLAAALLAAPGGPVLAAGKNAVQPAVDPDALNAAIDRELEAPEYAWRLPRTIPEEEEGPVRVMLRRASETLRRWGDAVRNWLRSWTGDEREAEAGGGGESGAYGLSVKLIYWLLVVLTVLLVSTLLYYIAREVRRRRNAAMVQPRAAAPEPPDLEDETTPPDALPEEGWLSMARELAEQGDYRLAVRALFLALLARLAADKHIAIARYKSNSDYRRELERRAHVHGELAPLFTDSARVYEAVWYGNHAATPEGFQTLQRNTARLRANTAEERP